MGFTSFNPSYGLSLTGSFSRKLLAMSTQADATLKAARTAAGVSIATAVLAAGATVAVTYWSWKTSLDAQQLELLRFAAGASTNKIAVCNIGLWKEAGLIRADLADRALTAFKTTRGVDWHKINCIDGQ
jgi:hypothetical protein